jgi:cytochrome b involved in lipid metabolism
MSKTFTTSDVASHNKPGDLYIIVDGDVYDLTKFQDDHPGELIEETLLITRV